MIFTLMRNSSEYNTKEWNLFYLKNATVVLWTQMLLQTRTDATFRLKSFSQEYI